MSRFSEIHPLVLSGGVAEAGMAHLPVSYDNPHPQQALGRLMSDLRQSGHGFDTIAVAMVESAVDALALGGYGGAALDGGVLLLVEAMWERAAWFRRCRPASRAIRRSAVVMAQRP